MHNTSLDLFCGDDNETTDMTHSIDNMGDTYLAAMQRCVDEGHPFDAVAIYEEWIVDGADPTDGTYQFMFLNNFTLEQQ